jgi:hypothetical protein
LVNSFNTMALTTSVVIDWVADSSTSNHTTSDDGNLTSVRPPTFTDPSSIIVANGSTLSVTSVGDLTLFGLFYLNSGWQRVGFGSGRAITRPTVKRLRVEICTHTRTRGVEIHTRTRTRRVSGGYRVPIGFVIPHIKITSK